MARERNLRKNLAALLKDLRMPTVRAAYRDEAEIARKESLSY